MESEDSAGPYAETEDVANYAALFLSSDLAGEISGEALNFSGGQTTDRHGGKSANKAAVLWSTRDRIAASLEGCAGRGLRPSHRARSA